MREEEISRGLAAAAAPAARQATLGFTLGLSLTAMLASISALGCGANDVDPHVDSPPAPKLQPKQEGPKRVRIAVDGPISGLDPAEATDPVTRQIVGLLYDQLVDWDPYAPKGELRLRPELLAELPSVSEDGLTLTLKMRTGESAPKFASNDCVEGGGRPVKASDVKASLIRHADKKQRFAYDMLADRIVGFVQYSEDLANVNLDADPDSQKQPKEPRILADDEAGTVTIELTRPQPEFVALLANPRMSILPPECPNYWDGFDRLPFRGNPVGSGPYIIDQGRSRIPKSVILVPNPSYSGGYYPTEKAGPEHPNALPGLAEIEFEYVRAPDTALRLFQQDELAVLSPGPTQLAEVFAKDQLVADKVPAGTQVVSSGGTSTNLIFFDMADPVVGKGSKARAVRRAISLAFDGPKYQEFVHGGVRATIATRLLAPGIGASKGEAWFAFAPKVPDLEAARKELGKAGVKELSLSYVTGDSAFAKAEAAVLVTALATIGITLNVRHTAHYESLLLDPEKRPEGQLFMLRFDPEYPNAENYLRAFTCEGTVAKLAKHCDAKYDKLFAEFSAVGDGPERTALVEKMERYLGDEAVVRPIDHPHRWLIAQEWIKNVVHHPLSGLRAELAHL